MNLLLHISASYVVCKNLAAQQLDSHKTESILDIANITAYSCSLTIKEVLFELLLYLPETRHYIHN